MDDSCMCLKFVGRIWFNRHWRKCWVMFLKSFDGCIDLRRIVGLTVKTHYVNILSTESPNPPYSKHNTIFQSFEFYIKKFLKYIWRQLGILPLSVVLTFWLLKCVNGAVLPYSYFILCSLPPGSGWYEDK